jgi:hypothetical protein
MRKTPINELFAYQGWELKKKGGSKAALQLVSSGEERNHMPEPWMLAFQPACTAFTATSGSGV